MIITMITFIDQYYYFQGAPDRAGQPLHAAVTLQYKQLAKINSTNSECVKNKENSSETLNFISICQNENSRLTVKIISIKTPCANAPGSRAETSRSATCQFPGCQSLSDSGKMLSMRANLMTISPPTAHALLYNISNASLYLTRDWGSQPQSGVAAVIMVARLSWSHADLLSLLCEIGHTVTRGDNDPAHIRARSAGLNQHTGAAGLSDLIIRLGRGHLDESMLADEPQSRKSISELIIDVLNHFLYTKFPIYICAQVYLAPLLIRSLSGTGMTKTNLNV